MLGLCNRILYSAKPNWFIVSVNIFFFLVEYVEYSRSCAFMRLICVIIWLFGLIGFLLLFDMNLGVCLVS